MDVTTRLLAAAVLAAGSFLSCAAAPADDSEALQGMKELKVAFDIQEGDGRRLLNRLELIDETRRSLIGAGVRPHFVLAFRGPATRLIQTDPEKIRPEDRQVAAVIATKLDEMRDATGMDSIELCAVAIRGQGTKRENVIPAVKVIGNTWISLAAYQARGYAYVIP